jgi:hypothetical protein
VPGLERTADVHCGSLKSALRQAAFLASACALATAVLAAVTALPFH